MTFTAYLLSIRACPEAFVWVADRPASEHLWRSCRDGSRLLWLCSRLGCRRELMTLVAVSCAWPALRYVPEGEERPRRALETTVAWCYGRATLIDVQVAAYATYAAGHATYAAAHATYAAYAAAYAAYAAAAAAAAAGHAAGHAADAAAAASSRRSARRVRKIIPWWHVADRLRAAGVEVEL